MRVIPIADRHIEYAKQVEDRLRQAHFRVSTDVSTSRMNAKIREAQLMKVPYMLVIGDKEVESGAVAVRLRSGKDLGAMPVADFVAYARRRWRRRRWSRRIGGSANQRISEKASERNEKPPSEKLFGRGRF
jgi:threonyl-tRNA synthetase